MADGEIFVRCFSSFVARLDSRFPEVQDRFVGSSSSEEDLFSYLWSIPEAHECLVLQVAPPSKSEAGAKALRTRGNAHYRRKELSEALKCYNRSILFAPAPHAPSQDEEGNATTTSEALALAYANRAAVLLELRQFDACREDLERALRNGYPEASRSKLFARQERCKKEQSEGGAGEEPLLTIHRHLPKVASASATMPATSDAISLAFAPDRGRHFRAKRDIAPGELLISEKCYSTWLLPDFLTTHCLVCLSRCLTPLPCPKCPHVIFCGDQCLSDGLRGPHAAECQITGVLSSLPAPWGVALRILTRATLQRIRRWIPELRKEEEEAMTSSLLKKGSRRRSRMKEELEGEGGLRRWQNEREDGREGEGGRRQEEERQGKTSKKKKQGKRKGSMKKEKQMKPVEREQGEKRGGGGGGEGEENGRTWREGGEEVEKKEEGEGREEVEEGGEDEEDLYRRIFHVVTNRAKHTAPQLLHTCAAAFCLTKLLQEEGGFFLKEDGTSYAPTEEEAVLVGSVLLRHLLAVKCNAFTVAEVHVTQGSGDRPRAVTIALGLSPCVALLNHSCSPTAFLSHCGAGGQALIVLRRLAKGDEVTIDYLLGSRGRSAERRRDQLLEQFGFSCACEACASGVGGRPAHPRLPPDASELLTAAAAMQSMYSNASEPSHSVWTALVRVRDALARSTAAAAPEETDMEAACELIHLLYADKRKPSALHLAAQLALEELTHRRFLHVEVRQGFY